MTWAPEGAATRVPTSAMRPFRMTTVLSTWAGAPVPSITVTLVIATTGLSTLMKGRSESRDACAVTVAGIRARNAVNGRMAPPGSTSIDGDRRHHAGLEMLGDVAMQHPAARVRQVEQQVHRRAGRHQHGVLPGQIIVRRAVHRQDQESLAMEVNRVLHPVQHRARVVDPQFDDLAPVEAPPDVHVLRSEEHTSELQSRGHLV